MTHLTQEEQAWVDEMVEECRPDNAEKNPETATFLAHINEDIRTQVVASANEKAKRLASLGVAIAKAAASIEDRTHPSRDGVAGQANDLLLEINTSDLPTDLVDEIFGEHSEDTMTEVAFYNLRDLIIQIVCESIKNGVPVTHVGELADA
ncbi:MAG: hypothetical protein GEU71_04610 [Actinobacteria bacterium]|nr:hypothetical protein [Actinomycetota bacterium]